MIHPFFHHPIISVPFLFSLSLIHDYAWSLYAHAIIIHHRIPHRRDRPQTTAQSKSPIARLAFSTRSKARCSLASTRASVRESSVHRQAGRLSIFNTARRSIDGLASVVRKPAHKFKRPTERERRMVRYDVLETQRCVSWTLLPLPALEGVLLLAILWRLGHQVWWKSHPRRVFFHLVRAPYIRALLVLLDVIFICVFVWGNVCV